MSLPFYDILANKEYSSNFEYQAPIKQYVQPEMLLSARKTHRDQS